MINISIKDPKNSQKRLIVHTADTHRLSKDGQADLAYNLIKLYQGYGKNDVRATIQ